MTDETHHDRWDDWLNAETYDRVVRETGIYGALNEELVDLAGIDGARRVLDLGCGTGATAQACLERLPGDGELVGIDAAGAMVDVARAQVEDPRAAFHVAAAEQVADVVDGPFDRVVCGAAFRHFVSHDALFRGLASLLDGRGARLVFNVAADALTTGDVLPSPFQVTLAREVEARSGEPVERGGTPIDPGRVDRALVDAGFSPAHRETRVLDVSQRELMRVMEVPALLAPVAPGLAQDERERALTRAQGTSDPGERVGIPWVFFISEFPAVG